MYCVQAITDFNQQNRRIIIINQPDRDNFTKFKRNGIYSSVRKIWRELEESDPEEQWTEIEEKYTYQVQNHHVRSHSGTNRYTV